MDMSQRHKCDGAFQEPGKEGWHNCMLQEGHKGKCRCPHGEFTPSHFVKEQRGGTTYERISAHNPRKAL